jgi:hypothetical protein
MVLLLNVGFDYVISHIAAAATKIPSGPQVATPVLAAQRLKTVEQFIRTFTFQLLHQTADCYLWRYGDEKVNVILGYVPLHDFYGLSSANLTDQFSGFESNVTNQHGFTILGYPNQMQMNGKNAMRTMTIIAHGKSLNKKC